MISNDILFNVLSVMMLFFLIMFAGCFFIFVYKVLGGPRVGRDSFLFFNFIFFRRNILSGLALIFLVLAYAAEAFAQLREGASITSLLANVSGSLSILLFGVYGKYLYRGVIDDKNPFFFIKVFLTKIGFSFADVLLWLSRFTYIAWIVIIIYN